MLRAVCCAGGDGLTARRLGMILGTDAACCVLCRWRWAHRQASGSAAPTCSSTSHLLHVSSQFFIIIIIIAEMAVF